MVKALYVSVGVFLLSSSTSLTYALAGDEFGSDWHTPEFMFDMFFFQRGLRGAFGVPRVDSASLRVHELSENDMLSLEEQSKEGTKELLDGDEAEEDEEAVPVEAENAEDDEYDEENDTNDEHDEDPKEPLDEEYDPHVDTTDSEHDLELDPEEYREHVQHLQKVGQLADSNNDSLLSHDELVAFAERMQNKKRWERTKTSFGHFDGDGDGSVGHNELGDHADANGHRFKAADFDGDGRLNETELHFFSHPEVHSSLLQVEAEHQFSRLDLDQDGYISFAESTREDAATESFDLSSAWEDFSVYDVDGTQDLSMKEFTQYLSGRDLLSSNIAKAIAAADNDGDGHIHLHEEVPSALQGLLGTEFIEDFFYHTSLHDEL